jgi:hypothetical protein
MQVTIPPQFPLHAIPKSNAWMKGSSGSRDRIIGIEKVRIRVVDAIAERNPEITTFRSINVKRIYRGFRDKCLKAKSETRSVMFIFARHAEIVIDPKKTKTTGSMKLWAKAAARSDASRRKCVLGSIPMPSQTAKMGTR